MEIKKKEQEESKILYVKPKILAMTNKTSMAGARCGVSDVSWKQVTCRC